MPINSYVQVRCFRVQTFELSLFRRFRDLDRDHRRRLNISVHHKQHEQYELLFFLRCAGGKPADYPLMLELSNHEVEQWLAKTRAALRLLAEDTKFCGSEMDSCFS